MGRIHKENPELSYGRYKELVLKNRQYAFGRFLDNSMVLTAVNNDDIEAEVVVNIGFQKAKAKDLFTDKEIVVGTDGKISLVLPPHRGCIVRAERE